MRHRLASQPQTMIGFLKSIGGLRSHTELALRDARARWPGLVNDKRGYSLDKARESCAEAGFLGADIPAAMAETSISDFLDALDAHPHYRPCDYDRAQAFADQRQFAALGEAMCDEVLRIEAIPDGELNNGPSIDLDQETEIEQPLLNPRHEKALAWRKAAGLSRAKLAEITGYSASSIQNFEEGGYRGKAGTDKLIPGDAWARYALACAAVAANLPKAF